VVNGCGCVTGYLSSFSCIFLTFLHYLLLLLLLLLLLPLLLLPFLSIPFLFNYPPSLPPSLPPSFSLILCFGRVICILPPHRRNELVSRHILTERRLTPTHGHLVPHTLGHRVLDHGPKSVEHKVGGAHQHTTELICEGGREGGRGGLVFPALSALLSSLPPSLTDKPPSSLLSSLPGYRSGKRAKKSYI